MPIIRRKSSPLPIPRMFAISVEKEGLSEKNMTETQSISHSMRPPGDVLESLNLRTEMSIPAIPIKFPEPGIS